MKKRIIIIIIIILSLIVIKYISNNEVKKNIYTGMVESSSIVVKSQVQGEINKIWITEGEEVKLDEIAYDIDDLEFKIQREKAFEKIKMSEIKINDLEEGYSVEEIDQIKSKISQNHSKILTFEEEKNRISDIYDQILSLKESGSVSENELKDSKRNLEKIKYEISGLYFVQDELNLKLKDLENGIDKNQIAISKSELNISKLDLESANLMIDKCHKKSPSTGIVENIYYDEGEYVQPGSPIFNILDLENLWVQIYVEEKNLDYIKLGGDVDIVIDSLDKTILGKVFYIARSGEFTPKNVESKESKEEIVYKVKVLPYENNILKPGMFIDIVIPN